MIKVIIQIVNYNQERFLINCLESLVASGLKYSVRVISNSPIDTPTIVRRFSGDLLLNIVENKKNEGFSKGNNIGFQKGLDDHVLVLNPDTIITREFVSQLLRVMSSEPNVGMVCGKLLRYSEAGQFTNIIDSTGIVIKKNRRVFDRGQGEVDQGQYDSPGYVFGCSGAAVLYRKEMLEDIKIETEYFDDDFFAYKEDVDLAWRAQLKGWKAYYNPEAIAYHARGWKHNGRKAIPRYVQIHSFKNRYLMMLKNDSIMGMLKHFHHILMYEMAALVYLLLSSPYLIIAWVRVFKLLPKMLQKRKAIRQGIRVPEGDVTKWFM